MTEYNKTVTGGFKIPAIGYGTVARFHQLIPKVSRQNGDLLDIIHNETVKKIAEKHNKTTAQVALRFLIDKQLVPVPKSWNPKRIFENLDVFDFKLTDEDLKLLEEMDQNKFIGYPPIPSEDKIIK